MDRVEMDGVDKLLNQLMHLTPLQKAATHDAICELCIRHGWTDGKLYDFVRVALERVEFNQG